MTKRYEIFEDNEIGYLTWLEKNPDGFVLNTDRPPRAKYMPLHTAQCHTITKPAENARSEPFTTRGYMKICANDPSDLLSWMKTKGATAFSSLCSKCKVADRLSTTDSDPSVSIGDADGWSEAELHASVAAYLEMQRKERSNEPFVKRRYYEKLSTDYGRSPEAFEYRMQNISYVLSLMGRDWITGLKPAKNVGKKIACQLEALLLELSQSHQSPVVAFEFDVRDNLARTVQSPPEGCRTPGTTASQVTQFKRDPAVKAWVLSAADGVCECCAMDAPFKCTDGLPFLEVHHVRKLADGGSDTISNAVALCPNCHRALHYGMAAKELLESLFSKVPRLIHE